MEEKITRRNVIEFWASKYLEVTRWLTKLQKKPDSALWLYRFCRWAHKTPPELLALKEKDPNANTMEKLLDDFCGVDLADFTNSGKYNTAIAVKSFFKHNYRDLAKASGVVTFQKVKPYNALNKGGLRKLWNLALNPRDRALIPFVTSTGIAKETLANLLWGHLEPDWETKDLPCLNIGSELLKGHGQGKYQNVRQTTFLTPEAKRDLIVYRDWMQEKISRNLTPQDHIWLTTYKPYEQLSYQMLGNQINILSHNAKVPFSLHDGRRWVNTALEQIGISTNWAKKIRGRKVRGEDAPYSQPAIEQLRAKFREAVPLLEFTHEETGLEQRVQRQEAITEIQSKLVSGEALTDDDRDKIKRFDIQLRSKSKKSAHCSDGTNCDEEFKQISEADLLQYLRDSWQIVKELANGEVIVKR